MIIQMNEQYHDIDRRVFLWLGEILLGNRIDKIVWTDNKELENLHQYSRKRFSKMDISDMIPMFNESNPTKRFPDPLETIFIIRLNDPLLRYMYDNRSIYRIDDKYEFKKTITPNSSNIIYPRQWLTKESYVDVKDIMKRSVSMDDRGNVGSKEISHDDHMACINPSKVTLQLKESEVKILHSKPQVFVKNTQKKVKRTPIYFLKSKNPKSAFISKNQSYSSFSVDQKLKLRKKEKEPSITQQIEEDPKDQIQFALKPFGIIENIQNAESGEKGLESESKIRNSIFKAVKSSTFLAFNNSSSKESSSIYHYKRKELVYSSGEPILIDKTPIKLLSEKKMGLKIEENSNRSASKSSRVKDAFRVHGRHSSSNQIQMQRSSRNFQDMKRRPVNPLTYLKNKAL